MGTKRRAVLNTDAEHLRRVEALVAAGRYRSLSDFVREAMDEKLARLETALLADEVERYCAAGHAAEDEELIGAQALEALPAKAPRPARHRRAPR